VHFAEPQVVVLLIILPRSWRFSCVLLLRLKREAVSDFAFSSPDMCLCLEGLEVAVFLMWLCARVMRVPFSHQYYVGQPVACLS
jgi:hypothetical protein